MSDTDGATPRTDALIAAEEEYRKRITAAASSRFGFTMMCPDPNWPNIYELTRTLERALAEATERERVMRDAIEEYRKFQMSLGRRYVVPVTVDEEKLEAWLRENDYRFLIPLDTNVRAALAATKKDGT
jgi:hypothetical protein